MRKLSTALLLLAFVLCGCTARNVTTFILSTPCEAALAGSGIICRDLLETMIELSMIYPPDSADSDEQIGPAYDDGRSDSSVSGNGEMTSEDGQIGGVIKPSVKQKFG